jgi:hypothetical protein
MLIVFMSSAKRIVFVYLMFKWRDCFCLLIGLFSVFVNGNLEYFCKRA